MRDWQKYKTEFSEEEAVYVHSCSMPGCDFEVPVYSSNVVDHFNIAHSVSDNELVIVKCIDCDFTRKFEADFHNYAEYRYLKTTAQRSKAGHISHNPDHTVEII